MIPIAETLAATVLVASVSIVLAALLAYRVLGRFVRRTVGFSIGVLLATAFLHMIPEAFGSGLPIRDLCAVLLGSLFVFFFLEKVALRAHGHHDGDRGGGRGGDDDGDGLPDAHGPDALRPDTHAAGSGGVFVLIGGAVHNFSDGIVIAGAFLASPWVGVAATLSILAHEVPHKIGDFIVLVNAHVARRRAIAYASLASSAIVAGGVVGLVALERMTSAIPYVLVVAAANFIYISLADLVPRMQRIDPHGRRGRDALWQVGLIALGVAVVVVLNGWLAD